MIKYALHPGYVLSQIDLDWHYIDFPKLLRLYKLKPEQCVCWDDDREETFIGRHWDDYIHLYPKYIGSYETKK